MKKLYVIYDKVAEESGPIFEAKNDGTALRNYNIFMQKTSPDNLADYELYCVGEIDHETNFVTGNLSNVDVKLSYTKDLEEE